MRQLFFMSLLVVFVACPVLGDCSVHLEWGGVDHFRGVADGCINPDPSQTDTAFLIDSWFNNTDAVTETVCPYASQPCVGQWTYVTSCQAPGSYTAHANVYKTWPFVAAADSAPFSVPSWSEPKVQLRQPYKPTGSPYRLPVTLNLPLFGSGYSCPTVYRQDPVHGTIASLDWCPADGSFSVDPGTTSQFEIPLSGSLSPGNVTIYLVTWRACDGTLAKAAVRMDDTDGSCHECSDCVGDPVRTSNGIVRYTETDPLPGDPVVPFRRTLNSLGTLGVFGSGWFSLLDAHAAAASLDPNDGGRGLVTVLAPNTDTYVFAVRAGVYEQLSPTGGVPSVLRYDAGANTFLFEEHGSAVQLVFDAANGRITTYRDPRSGRATSITYDTSGHPVRVSDSRGNWAWTVTIDANGLVTKIGTEGSRNGPYLTYKYNGLQLLEVDSSASSTTAFRKYQYAPSGLFAAALDGSGRTLESHTYDGVTFHATTSLGPSGDLSTIQYDLAGRVAGEKMTRTTSTSGVSTEYYLRDLNGRWRTVEITGRCTTCDLADTVFGYDENGNRTHEQDARGYVMVRAYDTQGRLASEDGPFLPTGCTADDISCRFTPDTITTGALSPTSTTRHTTYAWDVNWPDQLASVNRTSAYVPSQQASEVRTYDPATGNLLSEEIGGWTDIPARFETRRIVYALYNGSEGAAFAPGGNFTSTWLTLPQPAGLRKSVDGPRTDVADVTLFVYYPVDTHVTAALRGRLAATKAADGTIVRYENYDAFGNVLRYVDANGIATEHTYDALGRMLTTVVRGTKGCDTAADPLCATDLTTTIAYDSTTGPVRNVTTPTSMVTVYDYDTRGRQIAESRGPTTTDLREQRTFDYDDSTGRVRQISLKANTGGVWTTKSSVRYAFEADGRLWRTFFPPYATPDTDGAHIEYTYDAAGNVRTMQDERHTTHNVEYDVDDAGAVSAMRQWLGTSWITTTYERDLNHNLTAVTDPNLNRTAYTVDDFGQVLRTVSPVSGTSTSSYDPAGHLTQLTDARGAVATHSYDGMGRPTQSTFVHSTGTETVTRTYDDATTNRYAKGRLSAMTDPSGSTQYSYDHRGLLRREDRTVAGTALATSYKYDGSGNRTGITYPSGRVVTYTVDYAGRPAGVTGKSPTGATETYATGAAYQPYGPLSGLTLGNGLTVQGTFDDRYRTATRTLLNGATTIASYGYTYDAGLNVLGITDNVTAVYSRTLQYDDLARVTVANSTALWGNGSYAYDAMGNLTTAVLGGSTRTFTYAGATPLVSSVADTSGTVSPTYDAAGNLLSAGGSDTRVYSARNLMKTRNAVDYDYDGRNVRVNTTSVVNSVTTRTRATYTPEFALLELRADTGTPTNYVWFASLPIAQAAGTTVTYTWTDHLGAPMLQTNQAKAVTWRAEYDPYGAVSQMRAGSALDQLLRFPGQEAEQASGGDESYNIFRRYRVAWGRYSTPDALGLTGGMNLFAYALDNPVRYTDPLGLWVVGKYPGDAEATVVCNGEDEMTPWIGPKFWPTKKEKDCLNECAVLHENSHMNDIRIAAPSVCKGKGLNLRVEASTLAERDASEVKGYNVEYNCLKHSRRCNGCCTKEVTDRKTLLQTLVLFYGGYIVNP